MKAWNQNRNAQFKCSYLLWDVINTKRVIFSLLITWWGQIHSDEPIPYLAHFIWFMLVLKKKIRAQISLFINTNLLFFCRTRQREARQLSTEWWTNPCWSISRGLFCQARAAQRNCSYLREGFIVHRHAEQIHGGFGYLHLSRLWSDLPILHQSTPPFSAAAVKRHAFIKCLLFQLLSSHVILLLDYHLRLPPRSCIPIPSPAHSGGQRSYSSGAG